MTGFHYEAKHLQEMYGRNDNPEFFRKQHPEFIVDDPAAALKADMAAYKAKHADDPPEAAPTPPAGATWQDSFNADKIKTCEAWIKWHLRDASAAIDAANITKKSGETPTAYNERVVTIVTDWLKQAKAAVDREYAAGGDERVARVMELVEASRTIPGMNPTTGVIKYLAKRGIDTTRLPDCVRCVPRAHGGNGGLIGQVTDSAGKITGLLETILTPEGNKAEPNPPYVPEKSKRAIGTIKGNAVKLPGTAPIILTEGLEEALTVWQVTGRETWACGGVGIMGDVKLPHAAPITLVRDSKDAQDSDAAHKFKMAMKSLQRHGHQVSIITSAAGKDLNDVLLAEGPEAVRGLVDAAERVAPDADPADAEPEAIWSHLMTRDPHDIPRRPWQIEGLLMLAVVTILCGHGGAGKSLWSLYIALMCALAQEWAGYVPKEAINVLIVNAEDGTDELDMRLESALQSFKGRASELRKIASERIHTVKIPNYYLVSKEGDKAAHRTAFFMTLLTYIREHKIGLLIFDPAVSAHYGLDENSAEMQFLIESFRILAVTCNIPVLLVHHYKKSGVAGDANSARGSSTMIDASRIVVTVDPMDAKEADNMLTDVEQRGSYFSTTLGKANYSRKAPRQWFRIDGTVLPNGESAPRLIVAEFGGDGETMSDADMEDFLDMVTEGRGKGKLYTPGGHDTCRLDHVLRDKFNIPRDRAKAIIGNLTKCGVLGLVDYDRGDGKTGKGYAVLKRSADATQVLM
jgi:RecA-family ATPase